MLKRVSKYGIYRRGFFVSRDGEVHLIHPRGTDRFNTSTRAAVTAVDRFR